MAKKKNKNLRDDVSRDNLPDISTTKPAADKPKKDKGQGKKGDKKHEQIAPPAAASLLCETIAGQIENFLAHDPEDRKNALDGLFTLGGRWPAGITGCDDAENYLAYQVERTARMDRDDDTKMRRMSTAIVVIDVRTHMPAFYLTAHISPSDAAAVQVYTMTDKGPDYKQTARWSNKKQ